MKSISFLLSLCIITLAALPFNAEATSCTQCTAEVNPSSANNKCPCTGDKSCSCTGTGASNMVCTCKNKDGSSTVCKLENGNCRCKHCAGMVTEELDNPDFMMNSSCTETVTPALEAAF